MKCAVTFLCFNFCGIHTTYKMTLISFIIVQYSWFPVPIFRKICAATALSTTPIILLRIREISPTSSVSVASSLNCHRASSVQTINMQETITERNSRVSNRIGSKHDDALSRVRPPFGLRTSIWYINVLARDSCALGRIFEYGKFNPARLTQDHMCFNCKFHHTTKWTTIHYHKDQ